jgi:hypothetical protein
MMKVRRIANGEVAYVVSGTMDDSDIRILNDLLWDEAGDKQIVLDLSDLRLVGREAIQFLEQWEGKGIELRGVAAYIRLWIDRERLRARVGGSVEPS